MIGFTVENHTVTEGMDMFSDITVDLLVGELGRQVVVTVSTQADTAMGKFIQGFILIVQCALKKCVYYVHSYGLNFT